jgi:hypothetical protein
LQGVFRLGKGWWLHPDELSVRGDLIRPLGSSAEQSAAVSAGSGAAPRSEWP